MSPFFRFSSAIKRDPAVTAWVDAQSGPVGTIARYWFEVLRDCGNDVRELMHDGNATACVGEVAFAYVGAYAEHVSVGFFRGAALADPAGLLEGTGRSMRHVKIRPARDVDATSLFMLIESAYADMKRRIEAD